MNVVILLHYYYYYYYYIIITIIIIIIIIIHAIQERVSQKHTEHPQETGTLISKSY